MTVVADETRREMVELTELAAGEKEEPPLQEPPPEWMTQLQRLVPAEWQTTEEQKAESEKQWKNLKTRFAPAIKFRPHFDPELHRANDRQ